MLAEDTLNANSVEVKILDKVAYFSDISDMHIGNMLSNKKKLKETIGKIKEIPNFYVMIGGDSTDNSSTQSASSVFDEYCHGTQQVQECVDLLSPIKDRILCMRTGNHGYMRAMKYNRLVPEEIIAQFIGVPCLQGCATAFMGVGEYLYIISSWHNSKKPDKMEWLHSDVTFYEHLHKNDIQRQLVMEPNKYIRKWVSREHYDIQSGSFLGYGGYATEKGYRPVPQGCPVIRLDGVHRGIQAFYDISQIQF